jgi:hypothetical protein
MYRPWPLLAASLLVSMVGLTGCATKSVYLLADGRMPAGDPVLNQQFEMDRTVCQGELQKANLSGSLLRVPKRTLSQPCSPVQLEPRQKLWQSNRS